MNLNINAHHEHSHVHHGHGAMMNGQYMVQQDIEVHEEPLEAIPQPEQQMEILQQEIIEEQHQEHQQQHHHEQQQQQQQHEQQQQQQDAPKKEKKIYKQVFNKLWLRDPRFRTWLRPNPTDKHTAYCLFCESKLQSCSRCSLLKHAESTKHVKNSKRYNNKRLYDGNHEMEGPDGHRGDGPISFIISDPAYANAQGANTSYRQRSRSYVEYEQPETNSKGAIEDDGCDAFGRYVASQLKKLPVREMLEVQIEIQQLLINKRMGSMEHDAQDKNDSHNSHMQTTHLSL